MAKKQNENEMPIMTIEGPLSDTNLVQKSNPLFSLWKSPLTLAEFKILDTYLSRINSREPESRTVVFEKGELEKLLGVVKINQPELDKRLEHLQSTILNVGEGRKIDKITLFERSQAIQDDYGTWKVCLTASQSAMKYIFNIEDIGYFRYQIRNIVKLKGLTSYILLLYFEHSLHGRNHAQLRIDVEELKQMLGCTEPLYNEYKYFSQRILQRCHKEINEKTDISFNYSTIRKNRKVAVIVFDIEKKAETKCLEDFPDPQALPLNPDKQPEPPQEQRLTFFKMPVCTLLYTCRNEFDENQVYELLQTVSEIDVSPNPSGEFAAILTFLREMYGKMDICTKESGITDTKRRFAYFKKMLENYQKEHTIY